MCEKLRATRQCSSIKDIFAPIHSQALSQGFLDKMIRDAAPMCITLRLA
jgi:hypothetical protein